MLDPEIMLLDKVVHCAYDHHPSASKTALHNLVFIARNIYWAADHCENLKIEITIN